MDVFEAIKNRRSTRSFTGQTVNQRKLAAIARAGLYAPSIGDLRDQLFIITNDGRTIRDIANACHGQYWVHKAGGVIAIGTNIERITDHYPDDEKARLNAHQGCGAAIQNMQLAAEALNIGVCWVTDYDDSVVERAFSPAGSNKFKKGSKEIAGILVCGHTQSPPGEKPVLHPENHIFFDEVGNRLRNRELITGEYGKHLRKVGYNIKKNAKSFLDHLRNLFT